jgi:hypothetical protein
LSIVLVSTVTAPILDRRATLDLGMEYWRDLSPSFGLVLSFA